MPSRDPEFLGRFCASVLRGLALADAEVDEVLPRGLPRGAEEGFDALGTPVLVGLGGSFRPSGGYGGSALGGEPPWPGNATLAEVRARLPEGPRVNVPLLQRVRSGSGERAHLHPPDVGDAYDERADVCLSTSCSSGDGWGAAWDLHADTAKHPRFFAYGLLVQASARWPDDQDVRVESAFVNGGANLLPFRGISPFSARAFEEDRDQPALHPIEIREGAQFCVRVRAVGLHSRAVAFRAFVRAVLV